MKYLLPILFLLCGGPLRAQDNPLRLPVDLLTGRILPPLTTAPQAANVRKAGVRSIVIQHIEERPEKRDTTDSHRELFSNRGDQVVCHHEFRDFGGFNSIRYNTDGTIAARQWKSSEQAGCGTGGMAFWFNKNYREYSYRKKQLVGMRALSMKEDFPREQIGDTAGMFTIYTYNDHDRLATEQQYAYDPWKPGDTLLNVIAEYRYNSRGQLLHHFVYDALYSRERSVMDSLIAQTPDSFTTILLRQSYHWNECGLHSDTVAANLSDEQQEARDRRDSIDLELSYFYLEDQKNSFRTYTGYEYGPSGLLTGIVFFAGDELSRRDTFTYDKDGQMLTWESWHLDGGVGRERWEPSGLTQRAQHWTWHFIYDGKGRVRSCRLERSESARPNYPEHRYHFRAEEETTYLLDYDARGRVTAVQEEARRHHYGFNPDFIPPLTTDTTQYLIRYEQW